jgi:phosphohistidine phosphatase
MNQLYMLRHGIAVPPGTSGYEDDERPLTPKGERRLRQVGRALRRLDLKLDRIVSSPLPRALHSAEIVADVLGLCSLVEKDDALRSGQSAGAIKEWLAGRSEQRLLIVGHDPAFSELVSLLVTGKTAPAVYQLRKGGMAAFCGLPSGDFQLDWLVRPRLFRRLLD